MKPKTCYFLVLLPLFIFCFTVIHIDVQRVIFTTYHTYQSGVAPITLVSLTVLLSALLLFFGCFYHADYLSSYFKGKGFADGKVLPYCIYNDYYIL
jgi:hypothetical protein